MNKKEFYVDESESKFKENQVCGICDGDHKTEQHREFKTKDNLPEKPATPEESLERDEEELRKRRMAKDILEKKSE